MPDYITRQEFDAAIESLRCVGDQQTINVTQTPGGQVITSTQVIDAGEEATAISYIDVAYDSDNDYYTVTFTDLPFTGAPVRGGPIMAAYGTVSRTFKFSGTDSLSVEFAVWRKQLGGVGGYEIRWYGDDSDIYNSDATTDEARLDTPVNDNYGAFQKITFNGSGGHTLDYHESYPVESWGNQESYKSRLYFLKILNYFRLDYPRPQEMMTTWRASGYLSYLQSPVVTLPFDSDLIIGLNGSTVSLDEVANAGSYSQWYVTGSAKIDADGNVRKLVLFKEDLITF